MDMRCYPLTFQLLRQRSGLPAVQYLFLLIDVLLAWF